VIERVTHERTVKYVGFLIETGVTLPETGEHPQERPTFEKLR